MTPIWRLYFYNKTCMARANRCPAGVITAKDHDQAKCFEYCFSIINPLKQSKYGVKGTGGGLCQTQIPLEFEISKLIRKK